MPQADYQEVKQLGVGGFGKVLLVKHLKEQNQVRSKSLLLLHFAKYYFY